MPAISDVFIPMAVASKVLRELARSMGFHADITLTHSAEEVLARNLFCVRPKFAENKIQIQHVATQHVPAAVPLHPLCGAETLFHPSGKILESHNNKRVLNGCQRTPKQRGQH